MDLSRVFGDQPVAQPNWGAPSSNANIAPLGTPQFHGDEAQAFQEVHKLSASIPDTLSQLQAQLAQLNAASEVIRVAYSQITAERDLLRQQVQTALRRLGDVQRVVSRYAVVEDPVVASDGYTYERKVIEQYLEECRESKSEGVSQQTKEVLTNTLVANQSLRKLVDLLKTVKPDMLGPLPKSADSGSEVAQRVAKLADDEDDQARPTTQASGDGRLHPCVRVYGYCNYKESCTYANYPYDACLSHLKGKCRFGAQCHEFHVDLTKRPVQGHPPPGNNGQPPVGGRGAAPPRK